MKSQRGIGPRITNRPFLLTFAVLLIFPSGFTQQTDDHYYVEPTPALRLPDEDLTTVLLVNNDNRSETHGRFLNVRPAVGLLTSTARTFIQEGVTTEYATQVLGTTLENGRLYAQLLKKSSRVLYDKDNIVTSPSTGGTVHTSIVGETPHNHMFGSPKLLLQSHNDLVADKDWQDVDDSLILEKNSFVVNTDYIATAPKASNIVYPVKSIVNEKGIDYTENNGFLNRNLSLNRSVSLSDAFRIKANKVRPSVDLPTFTVKNMFSPSGFSWESTIEIGEQQQQIDTHSSTNTSEPRSPKLLYHKIMKEERRPLSTVTYYGFADFTTIVGDSVIVFSPSTTTDKFAVGHVTSIKGEATLGHQEGSYVSNVAITITQDLIEPTFVVPMLSTNLNDLQIMPKDMREENKEEHTTLDTTDVSDLSILPKVETPILELQPTKTNEPYEVTLTTYAPSETTESTQIEELPNDDEETTTIHLENLNDELISTTTAPIDDEEEFTYATESEKDDHDILLVSSMSDIILLASTQQPTPTETTSRVMLSRPSDEEILQIFSSLARAEAAEKASRIESQQETTTENVTEAEITQADEKIIATVTKALMEQIQPETKVEGGATTIFFEDDPFLDFISPNSVDLKTSLWIQSSVVASVNSVVESNSKEQNNVEESDRVTVQTIEVTESNSKSDITEQPEIDVTNRTILPEEIVSDDEENVENSLTHLTHLNDSEMNFKPIIKEITENEEIEGCIRTSQVFLTQVPKTFTYYTTYLMSDEKVENLKSTSIETNIVPSFDISEATKYYCIQPTHAVNTEYKSEDAVLERPTKEPEQTIIDKNIDSEDSFGEVIDTTPHMESDEPEKTDEAESTDMNYEDDEEEDEEEDEDEQESGEDIELIYKTLYTTYTYLTTFFHDSTTSVSSRKEVVTNIITSSLDTESSTSIEYLDINPTASITADDGIASIFNSEVHDTQGKFVVQSSDLIEIDGILRKDSENVKPTTQLNDDKLAKTYYTTYTYYTTIFVDGETEVMSRTEVHMNVVGTSSDVKINSSPRNLNIDETIFEEDNAVIKIKPTATYDAILRTPISLNDIKNGSDVINKDLKYKTSGQGVKELESSSSSFSSRTEKKIVQLEDDLVRVRTDVQSSSSNGEQQIYENGVLEDQVSSESNRDEIIPSATLLLQTSFTTFTYYTTMYSSDTTNIASRLETITNIVTETLQPTKTLSIDEATLPITYFTTFTYWTKLAKDGEITTLSREETVSNIVTPSLSEPNNNSIEPTTTLERNTAESSDASKIENTILAEETAHTSLAPTTYYTTYTYYTTSYAGDQTITDSRFETVTNVLTPTSVTNVSPTVILDNIPSSEIISSKVEIEKSDRTISYDYKTIVDADEISTLYFKTVVLATEIDGSLKEIISSTSAINVDEVKKATLHKSTSNANDSTRNYKTGLVRLIEGTEFSNRTTTVYQSKVIGTIIDDRYAQIIESTSSFIIEKTPIPPLQSDFEIIASSTLLPTSVQTTELVASTSVNPLESSITDPTEENEQDREDEDEDEDENDENDEEDGENDRKRTRLSFQTKKRTFTPVIRPFASRNRPQFAPKRKNLLQSSATIITRSDFTPTITATPAIKSDSRGRFTSSRKSNVAFTNTAGGSFSSGGKRFGRPSKTSQFGNFASSSSLSGSRNRLQSTRTQGSSSGFGGYSSSRRSGVPFRGASTNTRPFSSAYGGNSRLRIRPSSSLQFDGTSNTAVYTTLPPESEEEGVTQKYDSNEEIDVTTENLRRNNNPLLRFRRPQVSRPPFQPGQRNTSANQASTRRPAQQKPKVNSPNNITTTIRPRPRAFQRPTIGQVQNRSRPQSSLFPPRRLFQPQNINQALDEEQKTGDDFDDNENEENNSAEYENDTDLDDNDAEDSNRRRRESFSKLLGKKRTKRQADSNTRINFRNRFRRPTTSKPVVEEEIVEEEPSTVRSRTTSRFNPRSHSLSTSTHSSSKLQPNSRAIRPTKPNSNNRAQFTLREKDTTPKLPSRPSSNFRRPTPNGISSRRTTTAASRPKAPRLKSYGNTVTESSHSSPRGRSSTSRTRATTRGRNRNDITTDAIIPVFDGTITVTHISPTEITIPVVNGKVTEYKNIVTTTTSTEVLIPNQYTTLTGQNGASTLILNREETSINTNGATEVTQFVLQESLTSTVIFTPTTIRGRKTSFAHVIPSTVYQVENIVSTMQANIAASAPLANILLSQLLLGNIGLNQPNINPLLALGGTQAISQPPATPTTEYKTRTSTYVTTVTNGMSTVIPLTFHGKEILTTIFDSSSNVITATEYFTDTIVVTPTQQAHAQQVNSLLLPLLLQQQLQGQSQIQPSLPVQHSLPTQIQLSDNLQELDSNGIQKYNDYNQDIDEYSNSQDESVPVSQDGPKSNGRKNGRRFNKQQPSPVSTFDSSVITLYVSGRRPGEFSTVLSTIQLGGDSSLYKRQINRAYNQPVLKSESADFEDFYKSDGSEIQEYLLPATNEITTSQAVGYNFLSEKTQSLESIVGDVGLWYAETSAQLENPTSGSQSTTFEALKSTKPDINTNRHHLQQNIHSMNAMFPSQHETRSTHFSSISNTESTDNGRFFQLDSYDDRLTINPEDPYPGDDVIFDDATAAADEARYNLATRVMSNGVEVIIAGDKNAKGQHKTNALRILPSLSNKPMTLAPSTLKDQMILMMPSNAQENYTISINSNNFITKTCLTTYTYRTTYLQDGMTTVESREKVVSNTATEERNYFKISPTGSLGVTLSRTPELAVGVFHTTYTYYNTIFDGDLPLVLSSQHILTNTITGPDDYISFLQPSEEATPVLETNTYFSSISLTKTLKESNIEKIVSTSNLLTQVVITESLPPRSTAVMTSYIAFDADESSIVYESVDDITKQAQSNLNRTVTTYLQNYQHDQAYLHTKTNPNSTDGQVFEKSTPATNAVSADLESKLYGSFKSDIHIYATKTYLTTFTYLTTLINTHVSATPSTLVNFHTRVIENVITESIPSYLIKSDLLAKFEKNLKISKNRESYVTMVTLSGGQSLEITAINILHTSSTEKKIDSTSILKPSVTLSNDGTTVFSALTEYEEPNAATDSDTASSENDEQFITDQSQANVQKNNTKTSDITSFPSVNQLIETFNFNRLQALGPVFNAMAGLIQNNFGSPALANDLKKNVTAVDVESKHSTKNITAYDSAQSHEGPIYIPVQNLQSSNQHANIADLKVTGHVTSQHLHISPPQADWFKNENKNHGKVEYNLRKPTYETPLLNGGIPISPGEVITANSDVIVGKPNGIQPRVPYSESNSDVGNALLPPPLPMSHILFSPHSHQQMKQTKAIPRPIPLESNYDKETNFDGILKPPPLNSPYLQQKPQFSHNMLNHNYRLNYAGDHIHQAQHQHHSQYQPQTHHTAIIHQHIPLQNTYNKEINQKTIASNKRITSQKPNYILYRPHDYDSQPQLDKKSESDLNKELYNNEILEIRKIPEVYSTDLPGRESMAVNSSTNFKNGNFKTLIKKVVDSNQPMLVDIKPSQITNIVIPRDNPASILIVESAVELHKNGQYYDEPSLYTDVTDTDNIRHSPSVRKPILSNQQVNVDTNVLSHNIDINVPPITFNKDTDFPHSTPVRGQIHIKEASNFHMPHITIPLTDNQIQVNLTPQNALTQKIVGTFFNNIGPTNVRNNDITESLKNIDPMRYSPSPISPITKIIEHRKNIFNKMSPNVGQLGIKQNTYSIPATSEIRRPINTPVFVSTPQYNQQTPIVNSNLNNKNVSESYFSETSFSHRPTYYFALREENTSTTKPVKVDESTYNPAPLLHLFYGLKDTAQKEDPKDIPVHDVDYWEKYTTDDEDEDATEDLNKMEDQKVSSSINIAIPLQNKIKKNELVKSEIDQSKMHTITNKSESKNLNSNTTVDSSHKSNSIFSTEPPTDTKQTDNIDSRAPVIGSESFYSRVNAVNNMGEHGTEIASSYSPSTFIPTGGRPIPIGKPFSKTKTTVKPNIKNQQSISINIGEGFKLRNESNEDQTTLFMPEAAINEFENRETTKNTQTENPFNLKYNKNIKKPLKTPLPNIRPQSPPTKNMQSSKNLNKMEFVNQLYTNRHNYRVRDSAEIFDSYESMNPHNLNYVNLASNESTPFKNSPQQNVALPASVPSLDIKPPPISVIAASENVVGLNPPPPRTTAQPLPRPPIPTPVHIPLFVPTTITNKRSNTTNRKPIIKHSYTTNRPVKLSTFSTKVGSLSYSRSTLRSKQKTIINSMIRTSPTSKIYATPSSSISRTASTVGYITPVMDNIPSGILISSKVSSSTIQNDQLTSSKDKAATVKSKLSASIPETVDGEKNTMIYDTESQENPILTLNQKIPDEILIEGSEIDQRRKLSITHFENHTIIYQEPPIVTENPSRIPETSTLRKSTRKRIIIPTKYVTNTHIITITTTKTSVITSHGIPSTQTLTLTKTKTSTLVDTVTETHTLLRPTKINEAHEMSPTKTLRTNLYPESGIQTAEASLVHEIQTVDNIHQDEAHSTHDMIDTMNPITTPNTNRDNENNSIFVVMTDKKSNGGVFSIIPSMIDTPHNINDIGNENDNSIGLDYDENITFNLPTRDEEVEINDVNHVLLGGVLIATPPKANDNSHLDEISTQCRPSCKASRNELCQMIDNRMGCTCRPGFARMFPDRPCRPTYTYAMQIPIHRISKQALHFKEQYRIKDSDDFKQLAKITHDAVDRMIMQSDLRDVYHGVHVTSFDTANTENGILGIFLIQLSDNSDEKRLVDVFKKYLRQNNFSLGGTDIFTTKNGVNSLEIIDFNECAHSQFHDCSENSRCFNLQGTYTCSCQEGYVDLSENSIYPGRICSAEIVGCERCHYHGKCVQEDKNTYPICECFHWYTGASCQVNLKILLIALVTVGTILFIMLLICVLLTCTRKKKNHNMQSLMSGIHIIAPINSRLSKQDTTDKRAMIKDSSSETSQNSLPYSVKDSKKQTLFTSKSQSIQQPTHQQQTQYRNINQRGQPSLALISTFSEIDRRHNFNEQNDRSLTVMIPRAKYHHSLSGQGHTDNISRTTPTNDVQILAIPLETETKSSAYQCNGEKNQKAVALSKKTSPNSGNHGALHTSSTGALVSAGFEVSATVGNIISEKKTTADITSHDSRSNDMFKLANESHVHNKNYQDQYSQYNTYKDEEKFIDSMDVWLDTIQQNELTAEARSFDETTIQAPTKSLRSIYDRQIAQINTNDEANTMAERDIGSTFLLPHTHLYKPDRDSDISGFDSI